MTERDHIRNILRSVAKMGAMSTKDYLDQCVEEILCYKPETKTIKGKISEETKEE